MKSTFHSSKSRSCCSFGKAYHSDKVQYMIVSIIYFSHKLRDPSTEIFYFRTCPSVTFHISWGQTSTFLFSFSIQVYQFNWIKVIYLPWSMRRRLYLPLKYLLKFVLEVCSKKHICPWSIHEGLYMSQKYEWISYLLLKYAQQIIFDHQYL